MVQDKRNPERDRRVDEESLMLREIKRVQEGELRQTNGEMQNEQERERERMEKIQREREGEDGGKKQSTQ